MRHATPGRNDMTYTLTAAAKATGKSKSTLLRAIQSSKLSATRDEISGDWRVDPAELHRLYPTIMHEAPNGTATTHHEMASLIKELRAQLEASAQRMADKDDTIADLRRRLDAEGEERRKLTAILTDQRTKAGEVITMPPPTAPASVEALSAAPTQGSTPPASLAEAASKPRKWWQF
jgi:hypothetical protein